VPTTQDLGTVVQDKAHGCRSATGAVHFTGSRPP